jgi:hypothetical protein
MDSFRGFDARWRRPVVLAQKVAESFVGQVLEGHHMVAGEQIDGLNVSSVAIQRPKRGLSSAPRVFGECRGRIAGPRPLDGGKTIRVSEHLTVHLVKKRRYGITLLRATGSAQHVDGLRALWPMSLQRKLKIAPNETRLLILGDGYVACSNVSRH